jgi:hypothetical protein
MCLSRRCEADSGEIFLFGNGNGGRVIRASASADGDYREAVESLR